MTTTFRNIDEYISTCPVEWQDRLNELRELIKKNAPNERLQDIKRGNTVTT